jgi:hypothetical protein
MQAVKLILNTDQVKALAKAATNAAIAALAFQIEGQTKANIVANNQVDTGFMLNSVYSVTPGGSTYGETGSGNAERTIAPEVSVNEGAAVAVGAEYAAFQEAKKSFLIRAVETVATQAEAICGPIFKEYANG